MREVGLRGMTDTMTEVGVTLTIWKTTLAELAVRYGLQILGAVVILFVGLKLSGYVGRGLDAWLTRKELDVSLRHLLVRSARGAILATAVVVASEKAGVPVTSLIAGLGVAGLGIGLGLQGVLGNVFAGLTILFTRPFKVGEYIEILGVHGEVTAVTIFTTTLLDVDLSTVVIPNRKIVGEVLHNHGTRRHMELQIRVAYATDLEKAVSIARAVLLADPRVLREPAPLVGIRELGESAILLSARPWVLVPNFESVRIDLFRALVEAYRAGGIVMPLPQREVRLLGPAVAPVDVPPPPAT